MKFDKVFKQMKNQILRGFIKGVAKKRPTSEASDMQLNPTLDTIHWEIQELESRLGDIGFWFSQNKHICTEEMLQQYHNAESRLAALSSAVLIKVRSDQEKAAADRLKAERQGGVK